MVYKHSPQCTYRARTQGAIAEPQPSQTLTHNSILDMNSRQARAHSGPQASTLCPPSTTLYPRPFTLDPLYPQPSTQNGTKELTVPARRHVPHDQLVVLGPTYDTVGIEPL